MGKTNNMQYGEKNNLKIAMLHHDIEPPEEKFKEIFEKKECLIELFDIRNVVLEELKNYDIIINRVYSSVASRDYGILKKILGLLKRLESSGKICINSYMASKADYSKYELFKKLSKHNILTPFTLFVNSSENIEKISFLASKKIGFPLVIKRDCGGKSYDIDKVNTIKELKDSLKNKFKVANEQGYEGGFILQEFMQPLREHDCRIGVVEGNFVFSYARSFVSRNSKDKWIASTSGGSVEFDYSATNEEKNMAIKANLALNASFSESDIILTNKGPCIIEVNISPSYFIDSIDDIQRMEIIADNLINRYSKYKKIKLPVKN